jgi:hypothetical protein
MELSDILEILESNPNESLLNLTTSKINEINYNILSELNLEPNYLQSYLKKLNGYKYIDEINELTTGAFIKWIPIINANNFPLHFSGIICEIKISDEGVFIVCKNFMHRYFTFKMEECLIFQKLNQQELVILKILDQIQHIK